VRKELVAIVHQEFGTCARNSTTYATVEEDIIQHGGQQLRRRHTGDALILGQLHVTNILVSKCDTETYAQQSLEADRHSQQMACNRRNHPRQHSRTLHSMVYAQMHLRRNSRLLLRLL
jgi:hypothetical protein